MRIALIGLGAIGVPIAHELQSTYGKDFFLIADEDRKRRFLSGRILVNGEPFRPRIASELDRAEMGEADLLIVCVKNYDLSDALRSARPFVGERTVILPLQNGVYSHRFFEERFPRNTVLRAYVQGPNTEAVKDGFRYQNPGSLHVGSERRRDVARDVVETLRKASVQAVYEEDIVRMVWKKWMLNVAGNGVTALTGADYSLFKLYPNLQSVCREAMLEFTRIADAEGIPLTEGDIDDVIRYYVSYEGGKKTSMLMDVINERKTENDYLAGSALRLARAHGIDVPVIGTLCSLMEVKEAVYMERKGCRATSLFADGVEYSDALRVQMNDLDRKMNSAVYARLISRGEQPEQLQRLLRHAVESSAFYSAYRGFESLQDFPVMDKGSLNEHHQEIMVHAYDKVRTHRMYTSGSTGEPLAVDQDLAKRERNIADLKYFGSLAGYSDHDSMCYLRARPVASAYQQERDNIWQLDSSSLSSKNLADYYHVIVEKRCKALIGCASTLEVAVDYWSEHFENKTEIRTVISTSEELSGLAREKLGRFFGESTIIRARYSNSEQGILGQEDGTSGEYVLNWASYYFEVLRADSDEAVSPGETGRVVVTDLYNLAFPMIRYDTGDTGRVVKRDGGLPVLVGLEGRKMDIIYDTSGEPVSPFLLTRTMRRAQGVRQWRFTQDGERRYVLQIRCDGWGRPRLEVELGELKKTLGKGARIVVEYTGPGEPLGEDDTRLTVLNIDA